MNEYEWARRAVEGDPVAFGELVCLHQAGVYNTAYRMMGSRQEAEDAAQEAFLRAYRGIRGLDPQRPAGPWLRRIAVNVCLDRLAERPSLPLDKELETASLEPGPEGEAVRREEERKVRRALLGLPPRYRAAIELRHFEDLSYVQMAAALGRPLSDVKSDLFRARRMLADRLKDMQ